MYRLSTYTKTLQLEDGNLLVSDLKNGMLFKLPHNWGQLDRKYLEKLEKIGIVTSLSFEDEFQKCVSEMIQLRKCSNPLNVLVITNYACNLRCPYCYQDRDLKLDSRNEIPAEDIATWINRNTDNGRELCISFMGGECLLNIPYIEKIMNSINHASIAKIVTNGVLLSRSTIDLLLNMGIKHLMISLDGPEQVHNNRRRDTYSIIMSNIREALEIGMEIQLNVKIDKDNADTISLLFEELENLNFPGKIEICFGFIQNTEKMQNHCIKHVFDDSNAGKAYRRLWKVLGEKHIPFLNQTGIGTCPRERNGTITIDCYGDMYKCISCAGNALERIGNIYSLLNVDNIITDINIPQSCNECMYLPICHGGCWYKNKLAGQHICRKEFFDEYTSVPFDQYLIRNRRE